jgi:hypothetical protein
MSARGVGVFADRARVVESELRDREAAPVAKTTRTQAVIRPTSDRVFAQLPGS